MVIGIKFCGGCNATYDRKDYLYQLMKHNPHHSFSLAKEDAHYNLLLLVCGCSSCCADYSKYKFDYKLEIWHNDKIHLF